MFLSETHTEVGEMTRRFADERIRPLATELDREARFVEESLPRIAAGFPRLRIVLEHVATSRQAFVGGALRALRWVSGRQAGLYSMKDVLGL